MNLMKLLTVGQSLNGGKPVLGKYKLQQILLPKFGSTVRPSKSARTTGANTSAAETPAFMPPVAPVVMASTPPVCLAETKMEPAPRAMDKTQKIPSGKILRRIEEPVPAPRGPRLASRLSALLQKQISTLRKKMFPVRSKKKSGLAPVQTEWSLEKVTVVRNDLNEADLEVIAPKPKAPAEIQDHKAKLVDLSRVKNSGREWIKMTGRLFKSNSPFESSTEKQTDVVQRSVPQSELAGRI